MKKLIRSLICLVLVLAMVMCSASTLFAALKTNIVYVPIGDSYTNGYRFEELGIDADIYPELFAKYLEDEGYSVTLKADLAINGIRSNDVIALLDETKTNTGDALTKYWQGYMFEDDTYRPKFISAVQSADIISIKLGYNNLVSYIGLAIRKDLGDDELPLLDG